MDAGRDRGRTARGRREPARLVRRSGWTAAQQSNADQQMWLRSRWSSSTSSRIASGSWSRCQRHSTSSCGDALTSGAQPRDGPDGVGGGAELVGGDVRDGSRLAGGVRGIPRRPAQVPGRAHRVAARRSGLHHRDLAPHPAADVLDRLAGSSVLGPSRLEQGEDVLGARRRPQGEQVVVGVGEGAAATDRHEARIADLREDHGASTVSRQRRAPQRAARGRRRAGRARRRPGCRTAAPRGRR